jgi:putative flavoprotein involved in K+ transport
MSQTHEDAIVIGGGQSGLAAAKVLRHNGLRPVVLEANAEPVGSWPRYYQSLNLFSPARYSALPGFPFPGDTDHYPHRDEVIAYLRAYAARLDVEIRTNCKATRVDHHGGEFTVQTSTGDMLRSPAVIAATGGFGKPFIPPLPGLQTFTSRTLHTSQYSSPESFRDQRIVIVGAGNSAVQIGTELSQIADVTLASRAPLRFVPQRPLGRDMHFWFRALGLDAMPIGPWLREQPTAPVFDQGHYRAAVLAGKPDRRPMFETIDGGCVVWADGTRERVDTLLWATGYRPACDYLQPLGALDDDGIPRQRRGLSTTHRGLGYVGLEWQRSLSSASLRGAGRDATYVVKKLLHRRAFDRSSVN